MAEPELQINNCYQGIVVLKKPFGVFVDIGYHFDWKCGSLKGLVHISKFQSPEAFDTCEPGQTVNVNYYGKNEQGYCLTMEGYVDLFSKYVGKIVSVKVIRKWDGSLGLRTENRYKTIMPVTKNIYEHEKDYIFESISKLSNDDIIKCEVIDIKENSDLFVVKWIFEDVFKKNIGKKVSVKVCKNKDGNMEYVADNKYKAVIPVEKDIYGDVFVPVKEAMKLWEDGKIIHCEVFDVEPDSKQLVVKWLHDEDIKETDYFPSPIKL